MKMRWKIRRRTLLVLAILALIIFVSIHLSTDLGVAGFDIGAGIDTGDYSGVGGLPSNQRLDNTPVVATRILSSSSVLGHPDQIYLDGSSPVLN